MPFQSSRELATQASKQLINALLHLQPAGPFNKVGDEQMLALGRLAAILEGALPSHKTITASPKSEIANSDRPLRVQITASPLRVPNIATYPRVVHIKSNSMQNSNTF
jgi:hypothetical protein